MKSAQSWWNEKVRKAIYNLKRRGVFTRRELLEKFQSESSGSDRSFVRQTTQNWINQNGLQRESHCPKPPCQTKIPLILDGLLWILYEYKEALVWNVDGPLYWQPYFQGAIYQTELYIITKKMIGHGLTHITKEKIWYILYSLDVVTCDKEVER